MTTMAMALLTALNPRVSSVNVVLARYARVLILLSAQKLVTVRGIPVRGTAVVLPVLPAFNPMAVGVLNLVQL